MQRVKLAMMFIAAMYIIFGSFNTIGAEESTTPQPVADIRIGSSSISWIPKISYQELDLIVSRPDGSQIQKVFHSADNPYIDLSSLIGDYYQEGVFRYELRVTSSNVRRARDLNADLLQTNDKRIIKSAGTQIQSGAFTVKDGTIINPNQIEMSRQPSSAQGPGISMVQDQVFIDDVIIQFSLCVGTDCVNGENFGFDTIRLKENNLRIRFQDTSNSGSFPTNDWEITINDSSNGGDSYFGVLDVDAGRYPFRIYAGAPANSLVVENSGRVGVGTNTPSTNLHVLYCNTPTLRLDQSGACGWSPQAWDIAGNEANFFIRDVTGSGNLPFRIKPGAPSNSIFINNNGRIGFGTDSPGFAMELKALSGTPATFVASVNSGASAVVSADSSHVFIGSKTNHDFRLLANDSPKITLLPDGKVGIGITSVDVANKIEVDNGARLTTGGTWTNASSIQYKENISQLTVDEASETLKGLNPVKFNYKTEKGEQYIGFIAEQVPELVATNDRKGLNPMDIVAVLTKVVQQQQETISELKKEITELKNK